MGGPVVVGAAVPADVVVASLQERGTAAAGGAGARRRDGGVGLRDAPGLAVLDTKRLGALSKHTDATFITTLQVMRPLTLSTRLPPLGVQCSQWVMFDSNSTSLPKSFQRSKSIAL